MERKYRIVNNSLGWAVFLVAAFVYCSTIEPTASFWDCPEFITTAYKLEIGHPPGAPFFMLTANLFTQLANSPESVARMVNIMSALLSASCIMFLFWTITHLTKRLITESDNKLTMSRLCVIEMSGLVGALIYTFSDTFWFSAIESEVYAYSSAFTAVVFWLILKWEDHADEAHSDRWLVLIAYMTGLSIGVHLLNLLCLPAIVLVFYYRRYRHTNLWGSIAALLLSFVLIGLILYVVIPGITTLAGWFELLCVNTLGMPFNTGVLVFLAVLIPAMTMTIALTQRRGWRVANTSLLCLLMLMIGYASYAVVVIRSTANTPMDQNSPEDVFTLGKYLARDQYGDYPLLYGQAYTSEVALEQRGNYCVPKKSEGRAEWQRKPKEQPDEKDAYTIVGHKIKYKYAQNMLFPRMWSSSHAQAYEAWMGGVDGRMESYDRCGETVTVKMPTQWENLRFFLSYQCNFMYWRYFMWNFAGRQNDIQGRGEPEHGNWLTGIPFIDNWRLGDQSLLPDELKENKGHNVFYCLPLLLGLIGLFWQGLRKGERGIRQFWVVCFLFFMTGLAIIIYLNQTPLQPRERDYAYAGSFYAFAIWCGMGVAALTEWSLATKPSLERARRRARNLLRGIILAACLCVPIQMATQTWDDHDRSHRYICRDAGVNYLASTQSSANPILLSNADNDTFPLWYCQEVEGLRTDVRVCNLQYLSTDWYIDQLRRPAYDTPGVPIDWQRTEYMTGQNEYVEVVPEAKDEVLRYCREHPEEAREQFGDEPFELRNILRYWVRGQNADMHVIPTDTLYIKVDAEAVRKSGMAMASDSIPERMVISLKGHRALYKNQLMLLEMLAETNWTRPIYVCNSVGADDYLGLDDHVIAEGLAGRIIPFKTNQPGHKSIDTKRAYEHVMHQFRFTETNRPDIYLDETNRGMLYRYRRLFAQLALALIAEEQPEKARKVLQKAERVTPYYNIPANFIYGSDNDIALAYALLGQHQQARRVIEALWSRSRQYLDWYTGQGDERLAQSQRECAEHLYVMQRVLETADLVDRRWGDQLERQLNAYAARCTR